MPWVLLTNIKGPRGLKGDTGSGWNVTPLAVNSDIYTLTDGVYSATPNVANAVGLPGGRGGRLTVSKWGDGVGEILSWKMIGGSTQEWENRKAGISWSGWLPTEYAAANEHMVRERAMMLRTGCPRVTTRGAVVFVFDHGLTKFKSIVWPLLQARNLPVTLALNPGTMGDANNSGATYNDIKAWIATGRLEPANHSYDHVAIADSNGNLGALHRAIRGSREELEAKLGVPIDTWVQNGNDMADMPVDMQDPHAYHKTIAGRLIYDSHGAVAGSSNAWPAAQVRPLGQPLLGLNGVWLDSGATGVTAAQTAIQAAIDGGGYQIIRLHPQFLNDSGFITTAQLTAFLDWVKGKVDAGELTALTMREALTARHTASPDTGWRNITSSMSVTPTAGTILVRRVGERVSLRFENVRFAAATSGTILTLPTGFRPSITEATTARGVNGVVQVSAAGFLQLYTFETGRIDGGLDLVTQQPWPSVLPGVAV